MNLANTSDEIIAKWSLDFSSALQAAKISVGIKHKRKFQPFKSKVTYKTKAGGEVISTRMSRGEIFAEKGVGRSGARQKKEWYNPTADEKVEVLADELAESFGDIIANHYKI